MAGWACGWCFVPVHGVVIPSRENTFRMLRPGHRAPTQSKTATSAAHPVISLQSPHLVGVNFFACGDAAVESGCDICRGEFFRPVLDLRVDRLPGLRQQLEGSTGGVKYNSCSLHARAVQVWTAPWRLTGCR